MEIVGSVLALIGLIFLVMAVMAGHAQSTKAKRGVKQKATVIDLKQGHGIAPVIRYFFEGKEYNFESKVFTRPGSYRMDQELDIIVDPKNPDVPLINSPAQRWLMFTVLAGLGVLFLFLGIILTFVVS